MTNSYTHWHLGVPSNKPILMHVADIALDGVTHHALDARIIYDASDNKGLDKDTMDPVLKGSEELKYSVLSQWFATAIDGFIKNLDKTCVKEGIKSTETIPNRNVSIELLNKGVRYRTFGTEEEMLNERVNTTAFDDKNVFGALIMCNIKENIFGKCFSCGEDLELRNAYEMYPDDLLASGDVTLPEKPMNKTGSDPLYAITLKQVNGTLKVVKDRESIVPSELQPIILNIFDDDSIKVYNLQEVEHEGSYQLTEGFVKYPFTT